jgi:hypothetical protein
MFSSAGRAGESYKRWQAAEDTANDAVEASTVDDGSDASYLAKKDRLEDSVEDHADDMDWGEGQREFHKQKLVSMAAIQHVKWWLANGQSDRALKFFQDHEDDFKFDTRTQAQDEINTHVANKVALTEGADSVAKNETKEQLDARIEAAKKKWFPDNPEMAEKLAQNIKHQAYGTQYAIQHQQSLQRNQATNDLYELMVQNHERGGRDLTASEVETKFPQIYQRLDAKTRLELPRIMETKNRSMNEDTRQDQLKALQTMALTDKAAFMDQDPFDDKLKLNWQDRKWMITQRANIIREGTFKDRFIQEGISHMNQFHRDVMSELGVLTPPARGVDSPTWNSYISEMQTGIQTFIERHGHRPNSEEFEKFIVPGLLRIRPPEFYENWFGATEHHELLHVTPKELQSAADDANEAHAKNGLPPPTSWEIADYARRRQWKMIQEETERNILSGGIRGGPGPSGAPAAPAVPTNR